MNFDLRPYQDKCIGGVSAGWLQWRRQLGVMSTGGGKTILMAHLAAAEDGRTLILAHREQLVEQAAQKLYRARGILSAIEQGVQHAMPQGHRCVVASIQSMRSRLGKYAPDSFSLIICDEAHHALSDEWQEVLKYYASARVLGVTATPDRSDRRALGQYFQGMAFEVGLLELIGDGYLCPIRALQLPVELDGSHLRLKRGDISTNDAADLIAPQLQELASAVASEIWDRKSLIFLPRCDVSEAFAAALAHRGIEARHVAGTSDDRGKQLGWFADSKAGTALCNAMLLTEGYDNPSIDCIVCLRPTQSRSLYAQIVGRGTRIYPGKAQLMLLDPLWISGTIDLCKPADLISGNRLHRDLLQKRLDEGHDLATAEAIAREDVEEALAHSLLESQKNAKAPKGMVDPLAWSVGIHDSDLETYEPTMPWEEEAPTIEQRAQLEHWGIWSQGVTRGYAIKLLERLDKRAALGLASPKQVMKLRQLGFANASIMTAGQAGIHISHKINRFRKAA